MDCQINSLIMNAKSDEFTLDKSLIALTFILERSKTDIIDLDALQIHYIIKMLKHHMLFSTIIKVLVVSRWIKILEKETYRFGDGFIIKICADDACYSINGLCLHDISILEDFCEKNPDVAIVQRHLGLILSRQNNGYSKPVSILY